MKHKIIDLDVDNLLPKEELPRPPEKYITPVQLGRNQCLSEVKELAVEVDVDLIRGIISEFTGFDSVKDKLAQAIASNPKCFKLTKLTASLNE